MMSDKPQTPIELLGKEQQPQLNNTSVDTRLTSHHRAELYLALYKQQMEYFHETRRIEFQANLALWGAIFGVGYALAGKVKPPLTYSLGLIIGTGFLSGVWAWFLHKTKKFDKTLFGTYRARIERLLGEEPLRPDKPSPAAEHAWWLFYVVATVVFSTGVVLFLRVIPIK